MESGIHSSLHLNHHHLIVFAKFSLSIFYLLSYERTVRYFERANTELIRRAIDQFDWLRALSDVNVDEKVYFFTKTLLSIIQNFIPHEAYYFIPQLTNKCLDSIHFSSSDIAKIISHLNPNKVHGHNMLSIRMIKLCGNSICKPLSIIFNDCLNKGKFPHEWKKANVVPVHKKGNKQSLKNYRPISLLPICSKIFERLIYNEMFTFFTENNLISPNQSGFRPGDSCVNQLLAITHEIYKSFDEGFEVRGVFLDISKAFDKVWHEGLLLKLNQNGISGNLLNLLRDFLSCQKQPVILNG